MWSVGASHPRGGDKEDMSGIPLFSPEEEVCLIRVFAVHYDSEVMVV